MITAIDTSILYGIQNLLQNSFMDFLVPWITFLGDKGIIWIIFGILLLISKKSRKYGIALFVALLLCSLLGNEVIKNIVMRPRPCHVNEVALLIDMPHGYSFPSGHTGSSFAAAYVIYKYNSKYGLYAYILAALIGFSRLYLFVHYPSDVLCGALLGMFCGWLALKLYGMMEGWKK